MAAEIVEVKTPIQRVPDQHAAPAFQERQRRRHLVHRERALSGVTDHPCHELELVLLVLPEQLARPGHFQQVKQHLVPRQGLIQPTDVQRGDHPSLAGKPPQGRRDPAASCYRGQEADRTPSVAGFPTLARVLSGAVVGAALPHVTDSQHPAQ
ncbi:hypothetical protein GCM10010388_69440 [Streptomyces mauvecolor]|uniref:hypothetical protein n=1 Tax=Streptomyces mauvecolor TaxID=58345 RepID=UPI0031DDE33E